MPRSLISIASCVCVAAGTASAQTASDAGLIPHELVAAGFTQATAQLVVDRLGDEDVGSAWSAVTSLRASISAAQTASIDAQIASMRDPSNESLVTTKNQALASLETLQVSLVSATGAFESLLFDQTPVLVVAELMDVRLRRHKSMEPELLALDWEQDALSKLVTALNEERRARRRGDVVSNEAASLLSSARSQSSVITARVNLQTSLAGVKAVIEAAD